VGQFRSGFGWHLVRATQVTPAKPRSFEEARPDLRTAWIEADRLTRNRTAYEDLLRRYKIDRADRP
jgi:parvulin-like peptidyl-prolyl isomerase